ncbi:hypothetical protein OPIT5_00335 (plasmid) [Opitutaceae bacterium TAV5]|nr:hypothetical protein OPIT5_00335 [Opitutaceae bacterium TAV5]
MPAKLRNALGQVTAVPFEGTAFRVMFGGILVRDSEFKHLQAQIGAGRCNPGGIRRIYLALEKKTARAEFEHVQKSLDPDTDPDLVEAHEFAVRVKLGRILDICDEQTRNVIGIDLAAISEDWRFTASMTRLQTLGKLVAEGVGDFVAIRYPSQRTDSGINIVVFTDRLQNDDFLEANTIRPTGRLTGAR